MKKVLIITFLVLSLFFLPNFSTLATNYTDSDTEPGNDTIASPKRITIDDAYTVEPTINNVSGYISTSSDIDHYVFELIHFARIKIYFTQMPTYENYTVSLLHLEEIDLNLDITEYSKNELESGVLLPPGGYLIKIDGVNSYDYSSTYTYNVRIEMDPNGWQPEVLDVYDKVVQNTKAILWENNNNMKNDACWPWSPVHCELLPYYNDEFLSHRLYVLDREFGFYIQGIFDIISDEINQNFSDYEDIQGWQNIINEAVFSILGLPFSGITPVIVLAFASHIADAAVDAIHQELVIKNITEFLGEQFTTINELKNIYAQNVVDYFDQDLLISLFEDIFDNQSLEDTVTNMALISARLDTLMVTMTEDSYFYIDFYSENYNFGNIVTTPSDVVFLDSQIIPGTKFSGEGDFGNAFVNGKMTISSKIGGDFGSFIYYNFSGDEYNDYLNPSIDFMYDHYAVRDNYINVTPENQDKLKLIEINSSDAIDQLRYGTTGHDDGLGFLPIQLISHGGFSNYGIYSAVFAVSDQVNTVNRTMYYRTFKWEYPYKVYQYNRIESWVHDGTGEAYFTYYHNGFEYFMSPGDKMFFRQSSSTPEYHYTKVNNKMYDRVCFKIYERKSGFLGIPQDIYKKTQCYYIDEVPSTSDNADDFDYKYYHTSSLSTSTTTQYIGNYWDVSGIDGGTERVYMDPRSSVSDGKNFVKYIDYDEDYTYKYQNTDYQWSTYKSDGQVGDYYYDYTNTSGTFIDGLGVSRTSTLRYFCYYDLYFDMGSYIWVYQETVYLLSKPSDTSSLKYVLDQNLERRRRFSPGVDE